MSYKVYTYKLIKVKKNVIENINKTHYSYTGSMNYVDDIISITEYQGTLVVTFKVERTFTHHYTTHTMEINSNNSEYYNLKRLYKHLVF